MKNRLQIRYHIPDFNTPFTRSMAITYLQEAFAIGASNTKSNASLPAEPLVILYNDATGLTQAQSLSTANVLLAIGRGGDGQNPFYNQDYFVIDFAKHEEDITALAKDVENIFEFVEEVKATIEEMKTNIQKNTEDIASIVTKIGEKGDNREKDTVYGYIQGAYEDIKTEKNRAENAEQDLRHAFDNESTRAKGEEARIETKIENETTRAQQAESDLQSHIDTEEANRIEEDEKNRDLISAENIRATSEELRIETKLDDEISRAKAKELELSDEIHFEYERAFKAEGDLNKRIDDEVSRATQAEKDNANAIASEISRAKLAEESLQLSLNEEITRAKSEERTISTNLSNEIARSTEKDGNLEAADVAINKRIDDEVSRAVAKENDLQSQITLEKDNRISSDTELDKKIVTNTNAINTEVTARENADALLDAKIYANATSIAHNKVKSEGKTIIVTGPTDNGTNIDVNVDNKTIVINETGTLSVASDALVQYSGENAINISDVIGGTKVVSLKVNDADRILTNDSNGLLSSLSLKWVHSTADGDKDEIQLIGKDDYVISRIDVADFIKDGMLNKVEFDNTDAENPKIVFTFNSASGQETIAINVKELIDVYLAGNGLDLVNNVFSLRLDPAGESFLSVSGEGLKLSGIQSAINNAKVESETQLRSEIEKVNALLNTLDNKIVAEQNNRLNEDAKLKEEYQLADANLTKSYKDADLLLENAYKAADVLIETSYKAENASIRQEYKDADALIETAYKAADKAIVESYIAADEAIRSDYVSADNIVRGEFASANTALQGEINMVSEKIKNETIARENAITTVNETIGKILPEARTYADAKVSEEKTRAELSEQVLSSRIEVNTKAIQTLNGNTNVDGSVKDMIFDSALGLVVNTVTLEAANEQSLIKKFTIDGVPYFYTSNSTSDMKHNGSALNVVLDNLRSDVDNNETATNDLKNVISNLSTKVDGNSANINVLRTDVDTNKNDIVVLKQDVTKVEESVDELEKEISNTVNSLLAPMQATIASLQSEVAALKLEIASLKENAITDIQGTPNEITVVKSGNTATVKFADDAYFVAGV